MLRLSQSISPGDIKSGSWIDLFLVCPQTRRLKVNPAVNSLFPSGSKTKIGLVVSLGPQKCGKTSLIYHILGINSVPTPTDTVKILKNPVHLESKNTNIFCIDVGGEPFLHRQKLEAVWALAYCLAGAIILTTDQAGAASYLRDLRGLDFLPRRIHFYSDPAFNSFEVAMNGPKLFWVLANCSAVELEAAPHLKHDLEEKLMAQESIASGLDSKNGQGDLFWAQAFTDLEAFGLLHDPSTKNGQTPLAEMPPQYQETVAAIKGRLWEVIEPKKINGVELTCDLFVEYLTSATDILAVGNPMPVTKLYLD